MSFIHVSALSVSCNALSTVRSYDSIYFVIWKILFNLHGSQMKVNIERILIWNFIQSSSIESLWISLIFRLYFNFGVLFNFNLELLFSVKATITDNINIYSSSLTVPTSNFQLTQYACCLFWLFYAYINSRRLCMHSNLIMFNNLSILSRLFSHLDFTFNTYTKYIYSQFVLSSVKCTQLLPSLTKDPIFRLILLLLYSNSPVWSIKKSGLEALFGFIYNIICGLHRLGVVAIVRCPANWVTVYIWFWVLDMCEFKLKDSMEYNIYNEDLLIDIMIIIFRTLNSRSIHSCTHIFILNIGSWTSTEFAFSFAKSVSRHCNQKHFIFFLSHFFCSTYATCWMLNVLEFCYVHCQCFCSIGPFLFIQVLGGFFNLFE